MGVRAIVFDLDGTLIDSLEDIAVALDAALDVYGVARPTRSQVRGWIGGGPPTLVARALASLCPEPLEGSSLDPLDPRKAAVGSGPHRAAPRAEDVLARFRAHYDAAPAVHTRVFAGLEPVLDHLSSGHVTLGILTNKPHELAVQIANQILARWPFASVIGQRHGIALKPDPEPALMIAEELGVRPDQCALVGDAATDIETAHAAGMIPVGVTWGYRPREELIAANPSLLADQPADLRVLVS